MMLGLPPRTIRDLEEEDPLSMEAAVEDTGTEEVEEEDMETIRMAAETVTDGTMTGLGDLGKWMSDHSLSLSLSLWNWYNHPMWLMVQ